jgi:hypothetical protein
MSNPTPEQRAREILEKYITSEAVSIKHGSFVEHKYVQISDAISAMLEFATPEKESENTIKCPSCGADWNLSINNACSCGALLSTPSDKTKP